MSVFIYWGIVLLVLLLAIYVVKEVLDMWA